LRNATENAELVKDFAICFENSHHLAEFKQKLSNNYPKNEELKMEDQHILELKKIIEKLKVAMLISFQGKTEEFGTNEIHIYKKMTQGKSDDDDNDSCNSKNSYNYATNYYTLELKNVFAQGDKIVQYNAINRPYKKSKDDEYNPFMTRLQKYLESYDVLSRNLKDETFWGKSTFMENDVQYRVWSKVKEREDKAFVWSALMNTEDSYFENID